MSLILEALKKAERQHRLGEVPGLGASQLPEHRPASRWLGLLMLAGVALGMLVLGVYLGGGAPSDAPKSAEQEIELHPPSAQADAAVALDEPIPGPEPEMKSQPVAASVKKPAAEPEASVIEPQEEAAPVEPVAAYEPPPALPAEAPKRLSELPTGYVDRLPKMNIDIHSYDRQGRKSYVLINLEKYREGDYLAEGPLLSEIRPDGVVMEHLGERFFLPIGNR
jgi:general secretion pathway protein B